MFQLRHLVVIGTGVVCLSACSTPATKSETSPGAERPASTKSTAANENGNPIHLLEKGMSVERVKELLGEPAEIRPYQVGSVAAEIWVYRRTYVADVAQVIAGTNPIKMPDPAHPDQPVTIQEPVQRLQTTNIEETSEILVLDGIVLEWKQSLNKDRSIQ